MFFLAFFLLIHSVFAQIDWQEFKMGSSAKKWKDKAKNVSNPNLPEEERYILNEKVNFYGLQAQETELYFFYDRLYRVEMKFPLNANQNVQEIIEKNNLRGKFYVNVGYDGTVKVSYTDYSQKEFRASDLLRPPAIYVILVIIAAFVVWWSLMWLWVSYCPRCRSFAMKHIKREMQSRYRDNPDQSVVESIFSPSLQSYTVNKDHYKCKNCGYTKTYKSKKK